MSYIKLNRESVTADWMISKRPTAYLLLTLIAKRAKRSNDHPDMTLEIGEAEIGDYESYGATEQIYRDDKDFLKRNGQITTRRTNRGTIAKLISSTVFDINEEERTDKRTQNEQTKNGQRTTNKNDNNVKNIKKEINKERKELSPLELWGVAKKYSVSFDDVKSKYDSMMESIANGDKYKVVSTYLTLCNWVRMGIEKGTIETLDELSMKVEAQYHDPTIRDKVEAFKLKVQQEEKDGTSKPLFDFSKFRKAVS